MITAQKMEEEEEGGGGKGSSRFVRCLGCHRTRGPPRSGSFDLFPLLWKEKPRLESEIELFRFSLFSPKKGKEKAYEIREHRLHIRIGVTKAIGERTLRRVFVLRKYFRHSPKRPRAG